MKMHNPFMWLGQNFWHGSVYIAGCPQNICTLQLLMTINFSVVHMRFQITRTTSGQISVVYTYIGYYVSFHTQNEKTLHFIVLIKFAYLLEHTLSLRVSLCKCVWEIRKVCVFIRKHVFFRMTFCRYTSTSVFTLSWQSGWLFIFLHCYVYIRRKRVLNASCLFSRAFTAINAPRVGQENMAAEQWRHMEAINVRHKRLAMT